MPNRGAARADGLWARQTGGREWRPAGLITGLILCRRSRRTRGIRLAAAAGFVLGVLVLAAVGGSGAALAARPRGDAHLEFFKEAFLVFCVVCAGWYTTALRRNPRRREEYLYLFSLPLQGPGLYRYFLLREWSASLWVPTCCGVLFAGLAGLAPVPFLCRLTLVTLLLYAAVLVAVHAAHLLLMVQSRRANLLYKTEAWILLPALVLFMIAVMAAVAEPGLVTGHRFWLVLLSGLGGIAASIWLNGCLFERWHHAHGLWHAPQNQTRRVAAAAASPWPSWSSPWLWKNLLRIRRQTGKGIICLTGIFIALAYLAAMNNPLPEDRAAVLLALTLLYTAVFVYLSMQSLASGEEPPGIVYALPVRTLPWLAAVLLPAALWLAAVFLVTGTLVAIWSLPLAARFWFRAVLAGGAMLLCGAQLAPGFYPDLKGAQTRYTWYMLGALVLSALFFVLYPLFLALLVLLPARRLAAMRYFRISADPTAKG